MERRRGRGRGIWAIVLLAAGGLLVLGGSAWGAMSAPGDHPEVVYQKENIRGENMRPTYEPGDTAWFSMGADSENFEVSRGDVVLVSVPEWVPDGLVLSRVVAFGGDRIEYRQGESTLRLNGQPLDEPYILDRSVPSIVPFDVTVPEQRIFLLGDNRNNSVDSSLHLGEDQGTIHISAVRGEDVRRPTDFIVAGGAVVGGAVMCVVGGGLGVWALVLRRRRPFRRQLRLRA
ncbi:signal peptidase I [Streptomyces sp. NBC_01353]|uniref:signal peptidase I n=1 Tax=Streptomyces sp. NBC_01353 TaxID=2903835 RepID=UPI002E2F51DA|nr:signal peptidase I [Streptomyces sp. NBC_01353]